MTTYTGDSLWQSRGQVRDAAVIDAFIADYGRRVIQSAPQHTHDGTFHQPPPMGAHILWRCDQWELNSDLAVGQLILETAGYQSTLAIQKYNPAGLGAEDDDPLNKAIVFATPEAGIDAWLGHVATYVRGYGEWNQYTPRFPILREKGYVGIARTPNDLAGRYASALDYGPKIVVRANQLVAFAAKEEPMPSQPRRFHVALSYGHINTSGGDALETEQTPIIGAAVRDACRARGLEVRVVQEERGAGLSLDGVARAVVEWHQGGWPVDVFLEIHTEGGGGRGGVFGIYPDWENDYDGDAERIARDASARISAAIDGLGVRGGGAMSERLTGVGGQGYRLGVFRVTEPIKAATTRLIIEYGAHDIESDYRAVMANIPACGEQTAAALAAEAARLNFPVSDPAPTPEPADGDDPERVYVPETGHYLRRGFRAFYQSEPDALALWGYPISEEFVRSTDGMTVQYFERARFEWHPGSGGFPANPWDVVLGRLGDEADEADRAAHPAAFARRSL